MTPPLRPDYFAFSEASVDISGETGCLGSLQTELSHVVFVKTPNTPQ